MLEVEPSVGVDVDVVGDLSVDELSLDDLSVDADESPPEVPPFPTLASALVSCFARARIAVERSFFAQPEPLKWTVGGANAFRSVPSAPHAGQNRGPGASMPWITSVVSRQLEQR